MMTDLTSTETKAPDKRCTPHRDRRSREPVAGPDTDRSRNRSGSASRSEQRDGRDEPGKHAKEDRRAVRLPSGRTRSDTLAA